MDGTSAEALGDESIAEKFEQHGEAFNGFLGDVQSTVLSQLNAQNVGPEGFIENFQGKEARTKRREKQQIVALVKPIKRPA